MARYKWAELTGREIAFKPATFYLGIADHLARVVEGQESQDPIEDSSKGVSLAELSSVEVTDLSGQDEAGNQESGEEEEMRRSSDSKRTNHDITRT